MEENCIFDLFLFKLTLLANESDCLPKVCYLKMKKLRYLSKLRLFESVGASAPTKTDEFLKKFQRGVGGQKCLTFQRVLF